MQFTAENSGAPSLGIDDATSLFADEGMQLDQTDDQKQAILDKAEEAVSDKIDSLIPDSSDNITRTLTDAVSGAHDMAQSVSGSAVEEIQETVQKFAAVAEFAEAIKSKIAASMGQLKILFGVLQIISTFLDSFEVSWPSFFVDWSNSIQFVNLAIFDVTSIQCMFPDSDFYDKLLMQVFALGITTL